MLPDHALELLTAYVDGELSQRQRKHVVRLLHKSVEARRILKDLQQHAQLLQNLPARKLEPAFANQVMVAIQRQASPKPVDWSTPAQRRWPTWTRYAVAASVLAFLACGLTYLATRPQGAGNEVIAKKNGEPVPPAPHVDHSALVADLVQGASKGFAQPMRPERTGTRLAFEDLSRTEYHSKFVENMTKQRAVHLDVAVTNHRVAVQRLETVLQNKGIKVVIDPPARAKLNNNQPKTEYVIYAENVRPDELAAMLYELGTDERARSSIEALTISSVTADDQKQVSGLLGISREILETPPMQQDPFKKFIPKEETKPAGEPTLRLPAGHDTRVAMVLANEARPGAISSELQYFLNQRRQLQPGALQVIVVIHQA